MMEQPYAELVFKWVLKWDFSFISTSSLRALVVMPVLESFYTLKLCFISSLIGLLTYSPFEAPYFEVKRRS